MHGEKGFRLNEGVDLIIEDASGTSITLQIPKSPNLTVPFEVKKMFYVFTSL